MGGFYHSSLLDNTGPATYFPSVVSWTSFFLIWAGFFFEFLVLVSSLLDSSFKIQLGTSPPWLSSSFLLPHTGRSWSSSLVFRLRILAWQHLACTSHIKNYHRVYGEADMYHFATSFVVRGIKKKHWSTAHLSECGLPSAVSLNCLKKQDQY